MRAANVRLLMALKLASLGRGASGVRPSTVGMLEAMLARDLVPLIPSQGSVGASGDLAPLAHLAAAMLGIGEAELAGERMPAETALARAGLAPIMLAPKEGLALLNGTQFSTAEALAGLFAIERVFRAALVTGALSTDAAKGSDTPFDPRIHALRGHRGQAEVAAALRLLMAGSAIRASHRVNDERVQDPYCLRCQPQVMGAVLDVMRHATATLVTEANGVSDNPLIIADSGEALSGGNFHGEPVAFAADMLAIAVCEVGSLAERRIAMLIDPALSGLPAFLTPQTWAQFRIDGGAGDGRGAGCREQAARVSGQCRFDPDLGQPGGSRRDVGARRAPAVRHGGERRQCCCDRARRRRARLRASTPRCARARRSNASRRGCASGCRSSTMTATWRRISPPPPIWCAPMRCRGGRREPAGHRCNRRVTTERFQK